ncbi:Txnl4a [Symbiodinium natans]|uniref:Txnl4a protein n=1 Tax=Symbiodinium natans TaxID=878477 RepID=A0A812UGD1_9DINO|nr:Txnl4a [Symbiodinium natans]
MTDADQKAVSDSFEGLEGMNLPVAAFVEAFKTNPILVRKIALVTGFEEHILKSIPQEELLSTFEKWDTDSTGTLSFENFVQGLSKMRQFNRSATEQAEVAEEQAILDASVQDAKDAFLAAGGSQGSELDLQAFLVALSDASLVDRIATATGLPSSFFENLSVRQLLDLFKEVDLDCSGTISLEEWIEALVRIRMTIYDERKAELDAAMDAVRKHAEAALNEGDEDWSGEFDFREFIVAFKYNPTFVRKVSLATGIPVEELGSLQEDSIEDLFLALDTDYSGTVSFAEFVKGRIPSPEREAVKT